jgi:phosphotransferase system HPr (HPr) family protein
VTEAEVLSESAIVVGAAASHKDEAIDRVGRLLVDHGYVTADYVAAMRDREAIISTYLGNGIALPHGTSEAQATILRTGIAVVQYPSGVPWGDERARLVIGLAATSGEHIGILARLATILDDPALCDRLARSDDPREIHRVLTSVGSDDDEAHADTAPAQIARILRILNPHGLHARPAAQIVERLRGFDAAVSIQAGTRRADARSITGLLGLGASTGDEVTLHADGHDALDALEAVQAIIVSRSD